MIDLKFSKFFLKDYSGLHPVQSVLLRRRSEIIWKPTYGLDWPYLWQVPQTISRLHLHRGKKMPGGMMAQWYNCAAWYCTPWQAQG